MVIRFRRKEIPPAEGDTSVVCAREKYISAVRERFAICPDLFRKKRGVDWILYTIVPSVQVQCIPQVRDSSGSEVLEHEHSLVRLPSLPAAYHCPHAARASSVRAL